MQSEPAWRREPGRYRAILRPQRSGGCLQEAAARFALGRLPMRVLYGSPWCELNPSPGKDPRRSCRPNPTAPVLLRTEPEEVARGYGGGENALVEQESVRVSTQETADVYPDRFSGILRVVCPHPAPL